MISVSITYRLAIALALFVALQHVAFFVLETFLWEKPIGLKVFNLTPEIAAVTASLAKNQGVYNTFLAAGLFWGIGVAAVGGLGYLEFSRQILIFFLSCVAIAGIVGAWTVNLRIFFVQGLPALLALILIYL